MECAHGCDTWEEPRVPSKAVKGDGLQLGHEEGSKVPSDLPGKKSCYKGVSKWLMAGALGVKPQGYPVR
jgi:hypothetical protein